VLSFVDGPWPSHAHALANLLRERNASIPYVVATALLPLMNQLDRLDAEIKLANSAVTKLAKADPVAGTLERFPFIPVRSRMI
jgi:L-fucose mutarotase/ribose pyranase (RbsD/FucU family)